MRQRLRNVLAIGTPNGLVEDVVVGALRPTADWVKSGSERVTPATQASRVVRWERWDGEETWINWNATD
jgi:hypothetical protein